MEGKDLFIHGNAEEHPKKAYCSTSDLPSILVQVNFLVRQIQVPTGYKEEHRNLFRTRMFTFGGTLRGILF